MPLCIFLQERGDLLQSVSQRMCAVSMLLWMCVSPCQCPPSDHSQVPPDLGVSNCAFSQALPTHNALLVPSWEFTRALTFPGVTAGLQGGTVVFCISYVRCSSCRQERRAGLPLPMSAHVTAGRLVSTGTCIWPAAQGCSSGGTPNVCLHL